MIYFKITINPNFEIKNIFEFESAENFKGQSQIRYSQNKMEYKILKVLLKIRALAK